MVRLTLGFLLLLHHELHLVMACPSPVLADWSLATPELRHVVLLFRSFRDLESILSPRRLQQPYNQCATLLLCTDQESRRT
jgi:hypothetical protein